MGINRYRLKIARRYFNKLEIISRDKISRNEILIKFRIEKTAAFNNLVSIFNAGVDKNAPLYSPINLINRDNIYQKF